MKRNWKNAFKRSREKQFYRDHVLIGNIDKFTNTMILDLHGAKVRSLRLRGGRKEERSKGRFERLYATKSKLQFLKTYSKICKSKYGSSYHLFIGKKKRCERKVILLHYLLSKC